jgi:TatD DNase family protein
MIDMHCHLDLYKDPQEVVLKCKEQNFYILSVTTTPKSWHGTQALAKDCERIRTSLGLHPQLAHERYREVDLFDELISQAKYVGEIGLDGSKEYAQYKDVQMRVFNHILNTVKKSGGRIMSIHSRGAVDLVLDCLANHQDAGIPILHWFTGTKTQLKRAISMGCWFSVGPAMLGTEKGKSLVMEMPNDKVLTETDGPFAKLNRKSIMPWDVQEATFQLSEVWQLRPEQTDVVLIANLKKLLRHNM